MIISKTVASSGTMKDRDREEDQQASLSEQINMAFKQLVLSCYHDCLNRERGDANNSSVKGEIKKHNIFLKYPSTFSNFSFLFSFVLQKLTKLRKIILKFSCFQTPKYIF